MCRFDACEWDMTIRSPLASPPCKPSRPAGASCTRCTASTNTARRPRRPSAAERRAFSNYKATPRVPRPRAPQIRHVAGAALLPHTIELMGATTIFSRVTLQRSPRARLHPPQLGCVTPMSRRATPVVSISHFPYTTFLLYSYPSRRYQREGQRQYPRSQRLRGRGHRQRAPACRAETGSGAVSILAGAVKDLKNTDDGGRVSQTQDRGRRGR
ncbi:hypothetical protein K438DRAFT_602038 [Mycena galopus ATCC 62051]|nr:hypothetical protein K438DRAFT_602038 [Mycena galopus ATCC 62051]